MPNISEEVEVLEVGRGRTMQDRSLKMIRDWRYRLLQKKVVRDITDSSFKVRKGE